MSMRSGREASREAEEFTIEIPEAKLEDMYERLRRTRFPHDFANDDWKYGFNTAYLRELVEYWIEEYDWRATERAMNQLSHYKMDLDGVPLHFIHQKGTGPDPMPLIIHHGWPWTFWDLRKVIGPLADPASHGGDPADSFDVVLISLPGYGFSSPLTQTGYNFHTTADLEHRLMKEVLGYERFAAAGGDWGALISEQLGHKYAEDVIGVYTHLPVQLSHYLFQHPDVPPGIDYDYTLGLPNPSEYGEGEEGWYERGRWFIENESGYGELQLTKPQTLAALVTDSPAGQLAWITEKRYFWGVHERGPGTEAFERVWPKDDLITTAAVYFLTETGGTSSRFYWECRNNPWRPSHEGFPVVGAPTAVGVYAGEIFKPPKSWTEKYFNLQQYRVHEKGGHFAPLEVPDTYLDDVRTFFARFR